MLVLSVFTETRAVGGEGCERPPRVTGEDCRASDQQRPALPCLPELSHRLAYLCSVETLTNCEN